MNCVEYAVKEILGSTRVMCRSTFDSRGTPLREIERVLKGRITKTYNYWNNKEYLNTTFSEWNKNHKQGLYLVIIMRADWISRSHCILLENGNARDGEGTNSERFNNCYVLLAMLIKDLTSVNYHG